MFRSTIPTRARPFLVRGVLCFALGGLSGPVAGGAFPSRAGVPANVAPSNLPPASIEQIGPGLFRIGTVRLDQSQHTLRFPAVVNQREGNLEYMLVTTTGKTHESLLRTDVRPHFLQVGLLLLGAKGTTNALPEDPAQ